MPTKVQHFLLVCLLNVPALLSAFVLKYEDTAMESVTPQTETLNNAGTFEASKPRQGFFITENPIASHNLSSNIQGEILEKERRNPDQPINASNDEVHTALKRSVCREPSGADLEVQLQLFRSGFVTTEEPTGAFGTGVDSLAWLLDTGFPVFWEGEDCQSFPSDLFTVFPTTSLNGQMACPWRLVQNSEPNRYPRDLQYAQCACARCAEILYDSFSIVNSCRPVLRDDHVLRKTDQCEDGEYVYEPVLEPVPVACACIRPYLSTTDMDLN